MMNGCGTGLGRRSKILRAADRSAEIGAIDAVASMQAIDDAVRDEIAIAARAMSAETVEAA